MVDLVKLCFLQVPCKIGRAFKTDKSESSNGYFDCKVTSSGDQVGIKIVQVLSKAHAILLHEDNRFSLLDTGR